MSWVPDIVDIVQTVDPLTVPAQRDSWPAGTAEKAAELDPIGAPLNVSKRQAIALLKAAGVDDGPTQVLLKAISFRHQQAVRGPSPSTTSGGVRDQAEDRRRLRTRPPLESSRRDPQQAILHLASRTEPTVHLGANGQPVGVDWEPIGGPDYGDTSGYIDWSAVTAVSWRWAP